MKQTVVYRKCHNCNGKGYLPIQNYIPSTTVANTFAFVRTCPKCGGTGWVAEFLLTKMEENNWKAELKLL
ncbi:hypothetical protein J7K42_00080 [bacterium]|nr:hypothetical protein [bacterium]